ncbi:MAG: hypothetical protein AABW72_01625 [archaeon]
MLAKGRFPNAKVPNKKVTATIRKLAKRPRKRPLTQIEIAERIGVDTTTVRKYSRLSKEQWDRAKRIALSDQKVPTETIEKIKELAASEVESPLGKTRKLNVEEITRKMGDEGIKVAGRTVRAILINSGLRTEPEIRRLGKLAFLETHRQGPLPSERDLAMVKKILTDPARKIRINDIPQYIKEHGDGTITKNDVVSIYEKLRQKGKAKRIEHKAVKTNLFSPREKANKIKENKGLIYSIMKRYNCNNSEMFAAITAMLFEKLDEYDPTKGMKVHSFIGMHTNFFILNTFRKSKRERSTLQRYREVAETTSIPSDGRSSIVSQNRYSEFFTQEMPANLAPSERRAVAAYTKLVRRTIREKGRFPYLWEVGKVLDPEMPLSTQAVHIALNNAKKKYRKE